MMKIPVSQTFSRELEDVEDGGRLKCMQVKTPLHSFMYVYMYTVYSAQCYGCMTIIMIRHLMYVMQMLLKIFLWCQLSLKHTLSRLIISAVLANIYP